MTGRPPSAGASRPDAELVEAARKGHVAALGSLLERHRPALFAEALGILGHRHHHEIEDVVQEAFLQAVGRIAQLREPEAFRWWLRAILRNACYQRLRRPPMEAIGDPADDSLGMTEEHQDVRDEVWAAIELLAEHLRATVMLRHFSSARSYAQIAAMLGVPVGTVRSRLSDARAKLALALRSSAETDSGELLRRSEAQAQQFSQRLLAVYDEGEPDFFLHMAEDLAIRFGDGQEVLGRHFLEADFRSDHEAGVRLTVEEALASGSVILLEARFRNPAHDPFHCPSAGTLLAFGKDGRIRNVRIHMAAASGGEGTGLEKI